MLIPKAAFGIVLAVVVIFARFWFAFGEISMFAVAFAVFIVALQILMIVGLRFSRRTEAHTTVKPRDDWIDRVGSFWLLACAFGAFLGYISGIVGSVFPEQWRIFSMLEVLVTIVLPVTTMLPNVRYISRNAAFVQVPILFFVTLLPILVGIDSLIALITNNKP